MNVRFHGTNHEGEATEDPATVHIGRTFGGAGGVRRKVAIESPYEAKDALGALDRGRTSRRWDPQADAWTADLSSLNYAVRELLAAGWEVTVDLDVARAFEGYERGGTFRPDLEDR